MVVKVGSSLLTQPGTGLARDRIRVWCEEIHRQLGSDRQLVLDNGQVCAVLSGDTVHLTDRSSDNAPLTQSFVIDERGSRMVPTALPSRRSKWPQPMRGLP